MINEPLPAMTSHPRKVLFLVTEDWAFWRHRLPMARAARDAGFAVTVACRVNAHRDRIEAEGFRVVALPWNRRGVNPLTEIALLWKVIALLRAERPALIHNVAIKPAIHGALAAGFAGSPPVVTTVAGMGWVYASESVKARLIRPVVTALFRLLLNRPERRLIVQNPDDRAFFVGKSIVQADRIVLIEGSGVDTEQFVPAPEPAGRPSFFYVGRMLRDKGLADLIAATRLLRDRSIPLRVVLVGEPDPGNPASLSADDLRAWEAAGLVEWWGHRDDVAAVWREAHVAVLPTLYREGVPKALLEAGATGRPSIATDMPGCRDLVVDGQTGLLVPPGDAGALAAAMLALAEDPARRIALGAAARERVVARFSSRVVGRQTAAVYRALLP
ncbi:glycosyl transferase family 1 [Rhodospirillum rubrum]|nr:glycosyl transferase family 1 [Rhodospirillum rubrum]MBK1677081.1 glycosyl transferase family 1 [Rhodospirillum rubrum]